MKLIINADDFGASPDTVAATIEGFQQGWLSSATLMAGGPSFDDAAAFARENPQFSFGAHLTLGGDGWEKCVSKPEQIPDLATPKGTLRHSNDIRWAALRGRLSPRQLETEIRSQLERISKAGIDISHVDSHGHLHKFGTVLRVLEHVLPSCGIRRLRSVQDIYLAKPFRSPTYWLGPIWRHRIRKLWSTTEHLFLPASGGDLTWATRLVAHLPQFGSLELGVHPGNSQAWNRREKDECAKFAREAIAATHEIVTWRNID